MKFHRVMEDLKASLGLAAIPAITLGAFGFGDVVAMPVLLSCWATGFIAMQFPEPVRETEK